MDLEGACACQDYRGCHYDRTPCPDSFGTDLDNKRVSVAYASEQLQASR
jgi:hypothetical protein